MLPLLAKYSPLLSQKITLHPEWAKECNRPLDPNQLEKDWEATVGSDLSQRLRFFKYKKMIQVVSRMIAHDTSFAEVGFFWSRVAAVCLNAVHQELQKNLPIPITIFALGKLGSMELNLSSDIDLVFIYEREGTTAAGISFHELAEQYAQTLTKLLSEITSDGFCFRVDHDLRPEGSKGPLTNSVEAALHYYESFGRDWERMAWVRATAIAGDFDLGQRFLTALSPFLWRKHIRLSDLRNLKRLKEELEKTNTPENIKTGPGGIREIEFMTHALQLLYGGKKEELRRQNTLEAISSLGKRKIISKGIADTLTRTYIFWREIENALQAAHDLQTHTIPSSEEEWKRLADLFALSPPAFQKEIQIKRDRIHRLFKDFFETDYEKGTLREAARSNTESAMTPEEMWEGLAWFRHQEGNRILSLQEEQHLTLPEALKHLSLLAEVILEEACKILQAELHQEDLTILGLGRLGSREMDYYSDLDLIFLGGGENIHRLVQRLISRFMMPGRYGRIYSIDSDLRPGGQSGVLVTTKKAFLEYQKRAAPIETFFHTKTRVVVGEPITVKVLKEELDQILYQNVDTTLLRKEIDYYHQKSLKELGSETKGTYDLKEGPGGMTTLEAILRYLQMRHGKEHSSVRETNSFALLEALHNAPLLDEGEYATLRDGLFEYRQLILKRRLLGASSATTLSFQTELGKRVAESVGSPPEILEEKLKERRKNIQTIYDRIFSAKIKGT